MHCLASHQSLTLLILSAVMVACGAGSQPPAPSSEAHHEDHGDHEAIELAPEVLEEYGIAFAVAGPAEIATTIELPGEVQVNGDRLAHVAPRVEGVVVDVRKSLGDTVRTGEILAELSSRELADSKAAYLAAAERLELAQSIFDREERLYSRKISSEQDFLDARNTLAEARIDHRTAQQKLHTLGFDHPALEGLAEEPDTDYARYRIVAPFDGVIIERHLTLGETKAADMPVFTVADLATVWVDLRIFQKDIGAVRTGQPVTVTTTHGDHRELVIDLVQPLVGEETRTALARVVTENTDGAWHPGCFVTAHVRTATTPVAVAVPPSAVIVMEDGDSVVFVQDDHGIEPREVVIGLPSESWLEITEGLHPGERYVVSGGFSLKAELAKGSFGDGHSH